MKIVTAKELGEFLKLTEPTIYKLASVGEIPGFKIGDSWRFDMDEVLEQLIGSRRPVLRHPISRKAPQEEMKTGRSSTGKVNAKKEGISF
ncbi:MAG TPA: helix-turn-helix domain-containing protein [Thermodesulfobacteriota bacterium]|nr:helix-turn-helix domain-containing protein [Thermodesulfobacteriota bacterium]